MVTNFGYALEINDGGPGYNLKGEQGRRGKHEY